MNLLHAIRPFDTLLQGRSEGRIKSHESCIDVRAWSHDHRKRNLYLREWIRSDMPLCLVPVSTLIRFFSAMNCRSKGRVTPRCHPDCRSKVILDSITSACEAMRECLKQDPVLQKFVCEEELETSHWPYEKCLEALKNIKMFWRILLEKVFAINLRKDECLDQKTSPDCDCVREVARNWEKDMVHQASFVKNMSRQLLCALEKRKYFCDVPKEGESLASKNLGQKDSTQYLYSKERKRSRRSCTSGNKVVTADACCGNNCNLATCKPGLENFCKDYDTLKSEVIKLKKENKFLRCELQNLCRERTLKNSVPAPTVHFANPILLPSQHAKLNIPKPYESCFEDSSSEKSDIKDINSELIITMKNCQHESYRHVSLLQVLHKTNCPFFQDDYKGPTFKNEDPIKLLTKVQTTLQAMVRREMALATAENRGLQTNSKIEASFQRVDAGRAPQSSLIS